MGWRCFGAAELGTEAHVVNRIGSLHELAGTPNQDSSYAVQEERWVSVGVFDGHGDSGHQASELTAQSIRASVEEQMKLNADVEAVDLEDVIRNAFAQGSKAVDASSFSASAGTTATVVLVRDSQAVVGTVGDSSAAIFRRTRPKGAKLTVRWASKDHRLDVEEEKARIIECGGIIYEPYVVDKVERNKGLMVTRTMGDTDMRQNGVIDEPTIHSFDLQAGLDLFIIAASDGLWDADGMSVEGALPVIEKHNKKSSAGLSHELLTRASQTGPQDDCTIAVIRLGLLKER